MPYKKNAEKKHKHNSYQNRQRIEDMSNMDILKYGAYFVADKNANKKIDSEISLSDNIKQKIKAINHDFESRNDQEITGNVEKAISSLALVLHGVFVALPIKNSGYKGPDISKAYNGVKSDITYPGQAFIFLSLLIKQYDNPYLTDSIFELKGLTKKQGDMGRHTNFDSNNDLRKIADTYNDVIEGLAYNLKLNAIKRYKIVPNGGNKSLVCPYCHKEFGSAQGMLDHIKNMHTEEANKVDKKNAKIKKSIDPKTVIKRSQAKSRFIISSILAVLIFTALIITLSVGFDVSFVTSLWISAIVLYVSFGFIYELFPKKLLNLYFGFFIGRLHQMSNMVSENYYYDEKLLKFLSYTGIYVFLYPLTFVFAVLSGIVISAVTIIPMLLIDIF